jgi:hypothetical protein
MPKHRNYKKSQKKCSPPAKKEIQKTFLETSLPSSISDDQKSLSSRLTNQDSKIRENSYITVSTIDLLRNKSLREEMFSSEITKILVKALQEPIMKNALWVFAALKNVLETADLEQREDVLEEYLEVGLVEVIVDRVTEIGRVIWENWEVLRGGDLEKSLMFVEGAYGLLGKEFDWGFEWVKMMGLS